MPRPMHNTQTTLEMTKLGSISDIISSFIFYCIVALLAVMHVLDWSSWLVCDSTQHIPVRLMHYRTAKSTTQHALRYSAVDIEMNI